VERLEKKLNKSTYIEETTYKKRPVPFYNWLKERNILPQSIALGEPSLNNWLEW